MADAAAVLVKFNARADAGVPNGAPNPHALVKALAAAVLAGPDVDAALVERLDVALDAIK